MCNLKSDKIPEWREGGWQEFSPPKEKLLAVAESTNWTQFVFCLFVSGFACSILNEGKIWVIMKSGE